jgi:ABC-type nitrate/sulfonate/bicarbonate transport system permease component
MKPLVPVAPATRIVLGISFFVLFVAVWAAATFGGFVSKTFLADPVTMVKQRLDAADRRWASPGTSAGRCGACSAAS